MRGEREAQVTPLLLLDERVQDFERIPGVAVREDAHDVGAPAQLAIEPLLRIVRADLPPVFLR